MRTWIGVWLMPLAAVAAACGSGGELATVADIALPAGFPEGVPLPEGAFTTAYTGSAATGFEVNVETQMANGDLIAFVTRVVAASDTWNLLPIDASLPLLPGYESDWVIFTRGDEVITGPAGEYQGGIAIDGSNVNILLSPVEQPADAVEPSLLPDGSLLPRPRTAVGETSYTHGRINVAYEGGDGIFEELVDAYRADRWTEESVAGYGTDDARTAVGQLGWWRIEIRDFHGLNGGPIIFEFEDRSQAYP